jgi:ferric-dicitrate binding protein FerR (iron transport regulator)
VSEWNQKPPDDEDIARAVRELPHVEADPAFRERLRGEFVGGSLAEKHPAARPAHAPRRGWSWRWAAPAFAAAAALLFVVLNRAPAPRVVDATGTGDIRVDGASFALSDRDAWAARVRPGARLDTPPDAAVDILVDGTVLYEIAGGSRLTIPRSPGRWFNSAVECSLLVGELRAKTGPRFAGRTLRVYTPEGITVVSGTLISVWCSEMGTCVCVHEGVARVGVNEADLEEVRPGYRKIMMRDGTVDIISIEPGHRDHLIEFDARMGRALTE